MYRALGIDYGEVRIGVAISDPMQVIAKPRGVIINKDSNHTVSEISALIAEYSVDRVVVGLPLGMRGNDTEQTKKVRTFILLLESQLDIEVIPLDERLSTSSAISSLVAQGTDTGREKSRVDETAAAIILQEYLDSQSNTVI